MDPVYAPVALESPDDAFFQNGVERYVRRTYPQEEWVYQDWYFSVPEAYGGASTMLEAIIKKPETVFRNFLTNMGTGVQLPGFFFSGVFLGPISVFFFVFIFFGGIGLFQKIREDKNYSFIFSLLSSVFIYSFFPMASFFLLHSSPTAYIKSYQTISCLAIPCS